MQSYLNLKYLTVFTQLSTNCGIVKTIREQLVWLLQWFRMRLGAVTSAQFDSCLP
jgi:hypothetical protein